MPTDFAGGTNDPGTVFYGSPTAGVFTEFQIELQSQANALVDPSDTPTSSRLRVVKDSTGKYALQIFDSADDSWHGVEAT